MKREMTKCRNQGYRFVYIDETMFTRKTVPLTEWTRRKENVTLDQAQLNEPTLALLCGISKENGLEHFQIFNFSVNVERFIDYLQGLRSANENDKICLFLDNLSAHTSERSKEEMKRLKFRWVYNVPYSPQWNPIELAFSQLKRNFRKLRAKKLIEHTQESHEAIIVSALN